MKKPYLIGVAGGSASGKTSIVEQLKDKFRDDIELIGHDSYYYAHDHLSQEERNQLNYDHPEALETDRLVEDLKRVIKGESIFRPVYDFTAHNRSEQVVEVLPKPVIIVEGILVLEDEKLRDLMDLKIFVDTDADERLIRRIRRDIHSRGRSLESVLVQYANQVKPMHEKYIEPSRKFADLIIPHGVHNLVAMEILMEHVSQVIHKTKQ